MNPKIYVLILKDKEYYPEGKALGIAYEKDMEEIKNTDDLDDYVYHYVWEKEIDLEKLKKGDKIMLDVEFEVIENKRSING